METLSKLAVARAEKGWTQAQVAEYVEVDVATVSRWEKGGSQPFPRHVKKLCDLFGKTAAELGLMPLEPEPAPSVDAPVELRSKESSVPAAIIDFFQHDIELRLRCLIYDWQHGKKQEGFCALLQYRISQELKDFDSMTHEQPPEQNHDEEMNIARRDALHRLALFPIRVLGLDVAMRGAVPIRAPEEVLTHCAAGITACEHLAKGQYDDMTLAFQVLTTYLPPLKEIVDQSSKYREEAAQLVGQALLIKAMLSVHREGPKRAISYGKQAMIYGRESSNIPLQLAILSFMAWIYACDKQEKRALETALQAQSLLQKQKGVPIHPITRSSTYAGIAKYQAQNGQHEEGIAAAISSAYDAFSTSLNKTIPVYNDFNYSTLVMLDGQAYYHLGQYDKALETFAQAVDSETLAPKVPSSSERVYIEIINNQALASLKRPTKDMELSIRLWTAGTKGAIALRSEQRFGEALIGYNVMEALWPGDRRIKDLRDLIVHW
jgi:transcriptional regulator with XRE-family HTH domain